MSTQPDEPTRLRMCRVASAERAIILFLMEDQTRDARGYCTETGTFSQCYYRSPRVTRKKCEPGPWALADAAYGPEHCAKVLKEKPRVYGNHPILQPLITRDIHLWRPDVQPPTLDMSSLITVLLTILGLGVPQDVREGAGRGGNH